LAEPAELALREQFNNPEQQRDTATVGMWVFIITEVMLFGGLFTAFAVYRLYYYQAFTQASGEMDLWTGAINTTVLICSSLTMALAVRSAELGRRWRLALCLTLTMALGLLFLSIKGMEYYRHYQHHKVPGVWFVTSGGPLADREELFFVFYFFMTGLHAFHMVVGLGLLSVLLVRAVLGTFSDTYHTPVDLFGLYWHFVDMVWVFLFAIFYVEGAHLR
jgi:cytochrome c oxidase subunit 3